MAWPTMARFEPDTGTGMGTKTKIKAKFGRYLLLKRIARGGMAEIFRAVAFGEEGFAKRVAIKRMLPDLTRDPKFVDMFIAEAKLAAGLNHANIVQIHDFGCIDDRLYHAMEYVQGLNISEIVREMTEQGQPVPVGPACYIITEALYGLDHAHRQKGDKGEPLHLIHRDISPSNIIVSFDGSVKIADFGIAKATAFRSRTRSGVIKGKFKYMSPEQARGQQLDQRSDLFSLGVCLYKMLTLADVYPGKTEQQMLMQAREARFIPPRDLNPVVPEALQAIMHKAMHADRELRYPSAAAFRDALEAFMFEAGLQMFSSNLARYMRDGFGHVITQDQTELAAEADRIARAQPKAATMAELRAADDEEISTMVVDRALLDSQLGGKLADLGDDDEDEGTEEATVPSMARPTPFALPRADLEPAPADEEDQEPEPASEPQGAQGVRPLIWDDGAGEPDDWDDETEMNTDRRPFLDLSKLREEARGEGGGRKESTTVDAMPKAADDEDRPLGQRRTHRMMPTIDPDDGDAEDD